MYSNMSSGYRTTDGTGVTGIQGTYTHTELIDPYMVHHPPSQGASYTLTGAATGCAGDQALHTAGPGAPAHRRPGRTTDWARSWGGGTCTGPPRGTDPSPSRTCRAACTPAPPSCPPSWAAGVSEGGRQWGGEEKENIYCQQARVCAGPTCRPSCSLA